jgi:hypothetical protein
MADITTQEGNFTADVIDLVAGINGVLDLMPQIDEIIGAWNSNQYATSIDPDGLAAAYPGLTKQKLIDNITGLTAIQTAVGDYVSGHASNFVKLRNITRSGV